MWNLLIALAVALSMTGSATASEKSDVLATIHRWADSFNQGDGMKEGIASCAPDAIIIDDFSPHVWQGAGACARWYKDYEAFIAKASITEPKVVLGKTRHLDVESGYAYYVAPATLTYKKAAAPVKDGAVVIISLRKMDGGWRISGWAWADQ